MALSDGYEGPRGRTFLLGAVTGALVLGMVWALSWTATSGDSSADPWVTAAVLPDPERSREERVPPCHRVFESQSEPLRAAATSLSQWQIHLGAMNQLVAGTITLERAQRFWDQTRLGALRRLDRYDEATSRHARRAVRCPAPAEDATVSDRTCAGAVRARFRALRLAGTSLGTWRVHVHHMDMLRAGDMSPEEATRLWLRSWREGDAELEAYSQAVQATHGLRCPRA
jgi:hypothetical protein